MALQDHQRPYNLDARRAAKPLRFHAVGSYSMPGFSTRPVERQVGGPSDVPADRRASLCVGRRDVPQVQRQNGRVISRAPVVAVGVTSESERQVLGMAVGPSEDRLFWTAFLRSLLKLGLKGLVISDAPEGRSS